MQQHSLLVFIRDRALSKKQRNAYRISRVSTRLSALSRVFPRFETLFPANASNYRDRLLNSSVDRAKGERQHDPGTGRKTNEPPPNSSVIRRLDRVKNTGNGGHKRTMFRWLGGTKPGIQTRANVARDTSGDKRRSGGGGKINLNAPTCPCNVRSEGDDCVCGFPCADALYTDKWRPREG